MRGPTGGPRRQLLAVLVRRAPGRAPKDVAPQFFLSWNRASVDAARRALFACLSARFSFKDFPDFLLIACRGDLSAITDPFIMGA